MYIYIIYIYIDSWKSGWQTSSGLEFNKQLEDPQNLPTSLHRGDAGESCISSGLNVTFDVWVEKYNLLQVFVNWKHCTMLHHIEPRKEPRIKKYANKLLVPPPVLLFEGEGSVLWKGTFEWQEFLPRCLFGRASAKNPVSQFGSGVLGCLGL